MLSFHLQLFVHCLQILQVFHLDPHVIQVQIQILHVQSARARVHLRWLVLLLWWIDLCLQCQRFDAHGGLQRLQHALAVCVGIRQRETSVQQGHVVDHPRGVDGFIGDWERVILGILRWASLEELQDQRMARVDFQNAHGLHLEFVLPVVECLGAHDAFHVGGVAVRGAAGNGGDGTKALGDGDAHDRGPVQLLHPLGERLELILVELLSACHQVGILVLELDVLAGHVDELLAVKVTNVRNDVLVDRVGHVDHLHVLLLEGFEELRLLDGFHVDAGDGVNLVLPVLHVVDVFLKADPFAVGLGGLESKQLHELAAVRLVVDDTHLQ
mmetsp:Transcript_27027/g.76036  ORF Transcript_27027/g.76036 Transcript_27027/m.76036 type:complete len:327 (-) Transcript_27027:1658-2638(-)